MSDTITPGATPENPPEASAPKRGPGRPRKDGLPPGSGPSRAKKSTRANLPNKTEIKQTITRALGLANMMFVNVAIIQPMDALTQPEIALLSEGIADEVEGNEKLRKFVGRAGTLGTHGRLLQAIAMIVYSRLAVRGMIPGMNPAEMRAPQFNGNGQQQDAESWPTMQTESDDAQPFDFERARTHAG